jgi:hypothetical protein
LAFPHTIPAIVAAGDRGAAKAVYGESKVYLDVSGRPLVAHVVRELQDVPEVSEVYVIGDPERLEKVLGDPALRAALRKPLHVVPQLRNLYENAWQGYRRALPGAGPEGRDPASETDLDVAVLYLSGDLPFATAAEISDFVRKSFATGVDYALGLVTEESMQSFAPAAPGEPGIYMACFNLREGRFRQSNLHLAKPARLRNRHYIEEMYAHRYQRELWPIVALAWRLLWNEQGGASVVFHYVLMHLAGLADRWGLRGLADWIRRAIPIARVERAVGAILGTRFRFVVTEIGGCAVDIDNEADLDAARACYERWRTEQKARAAALLGAAAGTAPALTPPRPSGEGA